ncbi:MAG TPA: asparagine synthase-related protein [Xanthobacteraceae bacterium]|jgi:asparagine synthase (glutamine-hydrolysing)
MSAIFGILRFDGGAVVARDMERMSNALDYRGPHGRKFSVSGAVGLGHCLMQVTREDPFETQPLHDRETDVTLVADLRLDNREELAEAFRMGAVELRDMADSALVLRAYRKWGEDCAAHLLGNFAFAIWDGRARKLVLGRDHMGERSILYHKNKNFFVFATDMKALHSHGDVPCALTEAQLGRMLMHEKRAHDGATLFDGINGVTAATVMTVGADGSVAKRRYWEPHADPAHQGRDEAYYIEAHRHVLGEAVGCRIRRIVQTPGLVFSGGYDSAAIAGLAGPYLSGRKLVAAASVMPADYRGSIRHARRWADMCARDMPHLDVHYIWREGKSVLSGLDQAFLQSGQPVGTYHFVIHELLATLAGAGARLIMDGHGGDYTLHPRGQGALAHFLATFQLRRFVAELRGHLHMTGLSPWPTLRRDVVWPLLPPALKAMWKRLRHGAAPVWGDEPIAAAFAERLIADDAVGVRSLRINVEAKIDMRGQMLNTLRLVMDCAVPGLAEQAARHGLELTRPFHDKRVVELALAVPEDLYVKNGRNRYLASAALKDIYPREFQTRWRKNDDQIPDFQRMAKSIEPELLAEIARMEQSEKLSGYIDFAKVRRLLAARGPDDHASGWEQDTQLALYGFVVARYLQWFWRDNR